jgi:hypothetical protein
VPLPEPLPYECFACGIFQDSFGARAFGVMDVEGLTHQITDFVHLNQPKDGDHDSQLWKERLPATGTVDVIKLEMRNQHDVPRTVERIRAGK